MDDLLLVMCSVEPESTLNVTVRAVDEAGGLSRWDVERVMVLGEGRVWRQSRERPWR